jgi:hypothetical protein
MRRTGRTLTAGFLVLTGTGFLTLSGAGIAHAQPAAAHTPVACTELLAATKSYSATLQANEAKFKANHTAFMTAVDNYGNQVLKIASQGSSALQSDAKTYVTDLEGETAANDINTARIGADSDRLDVAACTPSGAPATGSASSATLQDPALFGAGGAAALAGLIVVGLTLRRRSRTSVDHG